LAKTGETRIAVTLTLPIAEGYDGDAALAACGVQMSATAATAASPPARIRALPPTFL
jgi:hypothetical protein